MRSIRNSKKLLISWSVYFLLVLSGLSFQVHHCSGMSDEYVAAVQAQTGETPVCCAPGVDCDPLCCTDKTILLKAQTDVLPSLVVQSTFDLDQVVFVLDFVEVWNQSIQQQSVLAVLNDRSIIPPQQSDTQTWFQVFRC